METVCLHLIFGKIFFFVVVDCFLWYIEGTFYWFTSSRSGVVHSFKFYTRINWIVNNTIPEQILFSMFTLHFVHTDIKIAYLKLNILHYILIHFSSQHFFFLNIYILHCLVRSRRTEFIVTYEILKRSHSKLKN